MVIIRDTEVHFCYFFISVNTLLALFIQKKIAYFLIIQIGMHLNYYSAFFKSNI